MRISLYFLLLLSSTSFAGDVCVISVKSDSGGIEADAYANCADKRNDSSAIIYDDPREYYNLDQRKAAAKARLINIMKTKGYAFESSDVMSKP